MGIESFLRLEKKMKGNSVFISKCMKITTVISTGRNNVLSVLSRLLVGQEAGDSVDLIVHVLFIIDVIKENHVFY